MYYTLAIAVSIVIMGLFLIGGSLIYFQSALASNSWASTTATITSAELVQRRVRGRPFNDARLTYVYAVDGQSYTGTRVSVIGRGESFTGEQVVARYPKGSQHPCYYNPAQPAESVLEKGTNLFIYVFPLLSLAVTVGGAVWAFRCGMTLRHRLG